MLEIRHIPIDGFDAQAVYVSDENLVDVSIWCSPSGVFRPNVGDAFLVLTTLGNKNPQKTKAYVGQWIVLEEIGFVVYDRHVYHERFDIVEELLIQKTTGAELFSSRLVAEDNLKEVAKWCGGTIEVFDDASSSDGHIFAIAIPVPGESFCNDLAYVGYWIAMVDGKFTIYTKPEYEEFMNRPISDITEEQAVDLAISDRVRFHQVLAIVREAMHEQDVETYRLERTRMPGDSRDMNLIAEQLTRKIIDITHG